MKTAMTLATLIAVTGCSVNDPSSDQSTEPSALVTLAPAGRGAVSQTVTLYGSAEAGATGREILVAPADAIVSEIPAPLGTEVAKGQLVVKLAPAPTTRLDRAKAQSEARAADAAFERAGRLRADGLVGDAEVEAAAAAAKSADATLDDLSKRTDALALRASVAGYIAEVTTNVGDQVPAGTPVVTIARPGDLRARFGADTEITHLLRPGATLRIRSAAGGTTMTVPIESIDPVVDPQTRLASVFANLPAQTDFAIGQTLVAEVAVDTRRDALIIPYAALLDDGGQTFVFVVKEGVAQRRDVVIGPVSGDQVAVIEGIQAGEQVITDGGTAVEDGMQVRTQ
jgi:membrane fusion protein, multidrug efflux system